MLNRPLCMFALFLTFTAPAWAESPPHRFFAGGSYGASLLGHDAGSFDDDSLTEIRLDDSDTAWKLFAGYRLSSRFAVEIGFVDLNNDVDNRTTLWAISDGGGSTYPPGPISVDIDEPRTTYAALTVALPLGERLRLLGKLGAHSWRTDVTTLDSEGSSSRSKSGIDALVGFGLDVHLGGRTSLRAEWARYADIVGDEVDMASIGISIGLGATID